MRDANSTSGWGRFPGEENGNPLEYSCLGNAMDREACQVTVHGVARVGHDLVVKSVVAEIRLEKICKHV